MSTTGSSSRPPRGLLQSLENLQIMGLPEEVIRHAWRLCHPHPVPAAMRINTGVCDGWKARQNGWRAPAVRLPPRRSPVRTESGTRWSCRLSIARSSTCDLVPMRSRLARVMPSMPRSARSQTDGLLLRSITCHPSLRYPWRGERQNVSTLFTLRLIIRAASSNARPGQLDKI